MKDYIKTIIISNILICTALAVAYCLLVTTADRQYIEVVGTLAERI